MVRVRRSEPLLAHWKAGSQVAAATAQSSTLLRSHKLAESPLVGTSGLGVGQCFNVDKALGTTISSHCRAANSKKLKMDPGKRQIDIVFVNQAFNNSEPRCMRPVLSV